MNKLQDLSRKLEALLAQQGAEKYAFWLNERQTGEFNAEADGFSLYRTLFENAVSLTVYCGGRMGSAGGNDFTDEGLSALVQSALGSANAAQEDPAHDIAPGQEPQSFHTGCHEPDMDRFFFRFKELLDSVRNTYPMIRTTLAVAGHVRLHTLYCNSNKTRFEKYGGYYSVTMEYSATDGTDTTGLDYFSLDCTELDQPLLDRPGVRKHLDDTVAQLKKVPLSGKFTGTVILTPDCLEGFLYSLLSSTVSDEVVLNGTSLWLDKLGQKVSSELLSLRLGAGEPSQVNPECWTDDGYLTEPVTVLENGVLQSQILSLFVSNKTGRPVTKNTDFYLMVCPGQDSLQELISRVERGLIVGGFSGGEPEVNGEFSGVAKNSFYVEHGKILGAVTETMISGNLFEMMNRISGLGREPMQVSGGMMPYLAAEGLVISGK